MSPLADERGDRRRRLGATALALVVGSGLATVHWLGLVLLGALVALPQRSPARGVVAGIGAGGVVVAAFLVDLALAGVLDPVLAMGQPAWLALAIGVGLPAFGSLARGVIGAR